MEKYDHWQASPRATTEGDTYLGTTLTFNFNSYIDADLWNGPNPWLLPSPAGDKITSTITLSATKNEQGQLTGLSATRQIKLGATPFGQPRDYFPGLGDDQNKASANYSMKSNGTLNTYNLNFEQHVSVSPSEEFGLNMMGYDIVNVAQQLNLSYSGSKLTVTAATDIFPSSTLTENGIQLFQYNQPSFENTHKIIKEVDGFRIPRNPLDDGIYPTYRYIHLRPAPSFYQRYSK